MWTDELVLPPGDATRSLVVGGTDLRHAADAWWERVGFTGRGLVVVDAAVADASQPLVESLRRVGAETAVLVLPGGERQKEWPVVSSIYDALVAQGVARDGFLVAVGGGALSDVAGFAAATYLRGIPWAVVPTTLLAQVDAALGGKTAIDLPQGKNLAGAFHLPRLVLIDPGWLASLPPREWRSGFGEVLKTALLAGGPLWESVRELPPAPHTGSRVAEVVEACARYKLSVVRADPREAGPRAFLNLGHTLGHAYEAWSGFGKDISHGEAVGVGLLGALYLSEQEVGLIPGIRDAAAALLTRWGMPTSLLPVPVDELERFLAQDKKRQGKILRWVLLRAPGEPVLSPVPTATVTAMLTMLGAQSTAQTAETAQEDA